MGAGVGLERGITLTDYLREMDAWTPDELKEELEEHAVGKSRDQLLRELPRQNHAKIMAEISPKVRDGNLERVIWDFTTGITAKEQLRIRSVNGFPGLNELGRLYCLFTGEPEINKNVVRTYFTDLFDLPDLTQEHQSFVDNLTLDYVAQVSEKELVSQLNPTPGKFPSLDPESNNFGIYSFHIHKKLDGDISLQKAILEKVSGINKKDDVQIKTHDGVIGTNSLGWLAKLFKGVSEDHSKNRTYFMSLFDKDHADHNGEMQDSDGSFASILLQTSDISNAVVERQLRDYAAMKSPSEIIGEIPRKEFALKRKLHGAVSKRGLERVVFDIATGITAIEEISSDVSDELPGINKLGGMCFVLSGDTLDYNGRRDYLTTSAERFGISLLTEEHQSFIDSMSVDYVKKMSQDDLESLMPIFGGVNWSIKEDSRIFNPYAAALHQRLDGDVPLQRELVKRIAWVESADELTDGGYKGSLGVRDLGYLVALFKGNGANGFKSNKGHLQKIFDPNFSSKKGKRGKGLPNILLGAAEDEDNACLEKELRRYANSVFSGSVDSERYIPLVREISGRSKKKNQITEVVKERGLQRLILELTSGITAKSEISTSGSLETLGLQHIGGLFPIIAGESMHKTNFRRYMMGVDWLPTFTKKQEHFLKALEEGNFEKYSTGQINYLLETERRVHGKAHFSLNESANSYSLFMHAVHDRVNGDRKLQAQIATKITGVDSAADMTLDKHDDHPGYRNLGWLVHLFTGDVVNGPTIPGDYLRGLLLEYGRAGETEEEKRKIEVLALREKAELVDLILGSESCGSDELRKHLYGYALDKTAKKIAFEVPGKKREVLDKLHGVLKGKGLLKDFYRISSGTTSIEELTHRGTDDTPSIEQFGGVMRVLAGKYLEKGEYRSFLEEELGVPFLSEKHQEFVGNLEQEIDTHSPEELVELMEFNKCGSMDPLSRQFYAFWHAIGSEVSGNGKLQKKFVDKFRGYVKSVNSRLPHVPQISGMLAGSHRKGDKLATHIGLLRSEYSGAESMLQAREAVTEYGKNYFRKNGLTQGAGDILQIGSVVMFPNLLDEYIGLRKEDADILGFLQQNNHRFTFGIPRLDEMNALKLAQDSEGSFMATKDYQLFIRAVFGNSGTLSGVDGDVEDFVRKGDLSKVSILEQRGPKSKNPNYMVRMLLSTNPGLGANNTLEAFVKLYGQKKEAERDLDAAMNQYLGEAGIVTTGAATIAKLPTAIRIDGKETKYKHALVLPFDRFTTFADNLEDSSKEELIEKVELAISKFHKKATQSIKKVKQLSNPQREVLEEKLGLSDASYSGGQLWPSVDYVQESKGFLEGRSELAKVYSSLGVAKMLNGAARKYASVIQGDLHLRNILFDEAGEAIITDYESACVGAPQIDEGRFYSHRELKLSVKKQREKVAQRSEESGVGDVGDYLEGYHAAVLFKTFEHMGYVAENTGSRYTVKESEKLLGKDFDKVIDHATQIYSAKETKDLAFATALDFKLDYALVA